MSEALHLRHSGACVLLVPRAIDVIDSMNAVNVDTARSITRLILMKASEFKGVSPWNRSSLVLASEYAR